MELTPRNKKGSKSEDLYQSMINPTSTEGILAKTAIQVFDPTGISSYPDVYEAGKALYNNPTLANVGELSLQTLGALPLIGKLAIPIKLAKGVSKLEKASKAASNVNKAIDTLPELLPITRNFSKKVQDMTSNLSKSVYNMTKTNNYNKNFETVKRINLGADVFNTSGSVVDLSELLKLNNNTFQQKLIPRNKKGGSSKNWIQSEVNPKYKGCCTSMDKARKHESGGLIEFLDNSIEGLNQNNSVEKDYIKEARELANKFDKKK